MRCGALHLACALLLLAACHAPAPAPTASPTRSAVPAHGRVTRITPANAPEVVPLAPEVVVPGAPFQPVDAAGSAMAHLMSYSTDDGLPMDDIACAEKDRSGMLWFGTNGGGLVRYDGHSFTTFTTAHGLPDNTIMSLLCDHNGDLWIGTSLGGLCRYDGRRFSTFVIGDATDLGKGITAIAEDPAGRLWFGSRGHGVYRLDPGAAQAISGQDFTILPVLDLGGRDIVRDLTCAPDGALWVSTSSGLARYDGRRFERIITANGDSLTDVRAMITDKEGTLWMGRSRGGLTRYAHVAEGGTPTHDPLLPDGTVRITQLMRAADGGLWIASRTHGAFRFQERPNAAPRVERIGLANGLESEHLECMVADRHGDLWFGTRGAGIVHYRGPAFTYFRGFKPLGLAEDAEGTLWVGTDRGIARFDGAGFSEQRIGADNLSWLSAVSIDPQGRVGIGRNMADPRRHGISWFDPSTSLRTGSGTYHVTSVPDDRTWMDIFWTMHDRRGRLWAGGRRGAELYAAGQRTSYTTDQGLGSNLILCMHEDRSGRIWVGTDGGGLSCIDNGPEAGEGSTSITTWTISEGLPSNVVWSIVEDKGGALWLGTLAGLCRYDGRSFLTYGTADGLPNDDLSSVALARDGHALFVGTLNGLAVLDGWSIGASAEAPGDHAAFGALAGLPNDSILRYAPHFTVHNTSTGTPVRDVQTAQRTIFEDHSGVLWIATGSDKSGLVRFDPRAVRTDTAAVHVQLLSVQVNNEPVCWYDLGGQPADSATRAQQEQMILGAVRTEAQREQDRKRYVGITFSDITPFFPVPQDLVLDHAHNHIGFTFVGVETARPELVEYCTMLEGYDTDWSPPTRATSVSYGNIHEGEYTWRLRAKGPAGVWSTPLVYRFTVEPPLHRTWWAYVGYALAVAGSIVIVIRRRTATLERQKVNLERIVSERTEELRHKKEEADQQRERAEFSERAKEQFLANMSHEIRTPMNAIMGMSDILRNRPHAPEQAKYLNAIAQSSENLLVIINDILDLSKIDAGRIDLESVPFAPGEVIGNVRDVLHFKAEAKGLMLVVEAAPDVPAQLIGDPTRLNQIVMNLVGNAIKFTEKGSVTIRAHAHADPAGRPGHCQLVIDVIDTGIGIPEDRLEKIFEEFTQAYSDTTRKYGGTGLGLTISRRLAQLQGGDVTVRSGRDQGSTFTVRIPYSVA